MSRLTENIEGQEKRRQQFHRRRTFDPDAPIDYINEKNRKFNEKLERYYGEYTSDLKVSLFLVFLNILVNSLNIMITHANKTMFLERLGERHGSLIAYMHDIIQYL